MSGSAVSLTGFAVLLAAAVALEVAGRRRPGRTATAGQAVGAAMRTAPGRLAVLAGWLWLGVHFLAR
ncbi:DUF6186 family protein [Blastococcus sp. SYSU D00669]